MNKIILALMLFFPLVACSCEENPCNKNSNLVLNKIDYKNLNKKQQENYNFYKVANLLANYGYISTRLNDDWNGADFLAIHINGDALKVQQKARISIAKKYMGKNLYIVFPDQFNNWYLLLHDDLVDLWEQTNKYIRKSGTWLKKGKYSQGTVSKKLIKLLKKFKL
ncbi:MAG: hypothetical protein DRQ51_01790 [Gammaproteobacteria bacterium]|nr:MAG: hypothetical protein DRQ51_01790 [Gammaproteobacteria bacterium]